MDKNVHYDKRNCYAYISVLKEFKEQPYSLIMDANTAINLGKFYYKPYALVDTNKKDNDSNRNKEWLSTMELLIDIQDKDPVFGFALQETCWDYDKKCINEIQYSKMEHALKSEYLWNTSEIIRNAYSLGHTNNFNVNRKKVNKIETLLDQMECNPLMLGSYACILKMLLLQKKINNIGREHCYIEFIEFMRKDIRIIHSIEANIAACYFLGKDETKEMSEKILKFGKKGSMLLNAWNACWDIFYLRLLQNDSEVGVNTHNTVLLTKDEGLIILAKMVTLEAKIIDSDGYINVNSFKGVNIRDEYKELIDKVHKDLYFDVIEHFIEGNNSNKKYKHLEELVYNLEQQVLKEYN